jgi:hypothetical protein
MRAVRTAALWVCWLIAFGAIVGSASARLHWSAARQLDHRGGPQLGPVACVSARSCVALDENGRIVSFDPRTGAALAPAVPHRFSDDALPFALAPDPAGRCPSGACGPAPAAEQPLATPLACPSVHRCVVVSQQGTAYLFGPHHAGRGQVLRIGSGGYVPSGLSCPVARLCVVVGTDPRPGSPRIGQDRVVSFDPRTARVIRARWLRPPLKPCQTGPCVDTWSDVGLACASATQCTWVTTLGEVTFDPGPRPQATRATFSPGTAQPYTIACPSSRECTLVGARGQETTFDPRRPGRLQPITLHHWHRATLAGLVCTSPARCVTIAPGGHIVSYDPPAGRVLSVVHVPGSPQSLACSSTHRCSVVEAGGHELTFDPRHRGRVDARPAEIDHGTALTVIACATERSCVAAAGRHVLSFDPLSSTAPAVRTLRRPVYGVACPSASLCSVLLARGREVALDPARRTARTSRTFGHGRKPGSLACASTRECVAATMRQAITYNPVSGRTIATYTSGRRLSLEGPIACPTTTQCTLGTFNDGALTIQPLSGRRLSRSAIDGQSGLACPGVRTCDGVDFEGYNIEFDPLSPAHRRASLIDPVATLTGLACRSTRHCIAIDSIGRALSGSPRAPRWHAAQLPTTGLNAIACPSHAECVAVDNAGDVFVGRDR